MHGTTSTTQKQEMIPNKPLSKKVVEFDDVISTIGNLSSNSDQNNDSDFEIALKNNEVPSVYQMLQNDKDLLTTNDLFDDESLLSWVVAKGSIEMLDMLLLNYPECRDTQNTNGFTPLMTAVITDDISLKLYRIEALLKAGAEVNVLSDLNDLTALHYAAERGRTDVVQALLNARAEVNAVGGSLGHTALHVSVRNGHVDVIQALLNAGAEVDANGDGFANVGVDTF